MNGIEDKHIEPSMIDTQHKSVPDSDEPKIEGKEFQTERERLF
jgi:hypothetical protein